MLPGAIDAHMHVEAPFQGCFGANDFYTQSISAAFGGVTTIAKLFGCFPQKGIIAPGSDADLVLINPDKEVTISPEVLHNNTDYSLFAGMKVKGYPVMTIVHGDVIVEDGTFYGRRGAGRFLQRKISKEVVSRLSR